MNTRNGYQHWLSNVRGSQLFTTLMAVALVGAFIGSSIVMAPDDTSSQVAANGTGPAAKTSKGPGGTATGTAGPDPAAGGSTAGGTAGGGTGGGGTDGAAGTDTVPAGQSPGATADVERVASDRGVTPDSIKLGFLVPNLGAVGATGFSLTDRGDLPQYAQALVDSVNRSGGVNGRQLQAVVRTTDPTSDSDMAAACQSMLNDEQVFGVIDIAISGGPPQQCIAEQGETPYAHAVNFTSEWMNAANGYDVSYNSAMDRAALTAIRDLVSMGWLDANSVVGVFGENCPSTGPALESIVKPALEQHVKKVEMGLVDCTIDAGVSQPPSIATQFRTAGVDRVLILSNFISAEVLINSMGRLGSTAKYAASDWWTEVTDSGTKRFDANQFEGAVGITSFRSALINAGQAGYPGIDKCNAAATEAGLQPIDASNAELNQYMCELFFIMLRGAQDAGPNPTRDLWRQAIQAVGPYDSFITGPGSFAPGKPDLPTQVFTAIWHSDCKCWKYDGNGFRPM